MRAVESLKICTQHVKIQMKKYTEELCFISIKSDAKFEEKLTVDFEIDMKN